jgi:hypothetical protein
MGIDPLGDACSLAEVLQQLLDSRRREGAIVTAWSTLEASEDAIAGDLAGSSPVDVLLEPARQARDGDEPLTGLASHSQVEIAIPVDKVAGGEVHQLADADACVAQDIEHSGAHLRQVGEFVPLAEGKEDGDQRIAVLADGLRGEAASSARGQEVIDQRFESQTGDSTVIPCDAGADTYKRKSRLWGCKKSVEASVRIQTGLLRERSGPGWTRTSDQPIMSRPL